MTKKDEKPAAASRTPEGAGAPPADPLALPSASRAMRRFSMAIFLLIGAAVSAFVLLNPFAIPFLPNLARHSAGADAGAAPEQESGRLYQCPMHPEVIESKPGNCPICRMKLVPIDRPEAGGGPPGGAAPGGAGEGREILYYYAPMDPTYISDRPGLSPMGMKLVPKYRDGTGSEDGVIRVDPVQVQNMGVTSEVVRRTDLNRIIRTVGILDFDADHVYWINTKFSGWIEKVYVNYAGQRIHKGQPLFEIYSPELVTTQEEYLRALEYRDSLSASTRGEVLQQAERLLAATRQRLEYWDISRSQIEALEQRQQVQRALSVTSPVNGQVIEVMDEALEGMFVKPGMNLYKLADLSSIWVHVDAFESDLAWINVGQPAEVQLSYYPGEDFQGKVLFLQPELDQMTRTVKVCVELPNPGLRMKPGMYANVRIKGKGLKNVVAITDSAILRSGERNVVFLDLGGGRYMPREVELGVRGAGNVIEIRKGLKEGQKVVVQAQFMLDSESRVEEAIQKFRMRGKEKGTENGEPSPSDDSDTAPTRREKP